MKRILFYVWYVLWPLIPVFLYIQSSGTEWNQYSLSVVLGIYAFIWLCNQFILAAKPKLLSPILGAKGILNLHSIMPVVIIILAALHRIMKAAYGFSLETAQARLGGLAWWLYALIIVFTLLFMANTKLMHIGLLKRLKDFVYAKTGLTYKRARVFHNFTVLGAFIILVHMGLASSSQITMNPLGTAFLLIWMLFSLALYLRYRLRGRNA
ncbi:MAG: hypothetical protein AB1404_01550 [Spirochaetota bacterium]|nr:hypothetical protein [Treponema sp.]